MKNDNAQLNIDGKLKNESLCEESDAEINQHRTLDSIAALSGGIAHDYNNLLTAIIGNITLARRYLNENDKAFRLLDHALQASEAAKKLTQKLITFSKGGSPNKEVAAVDRLVKSAVEFTLSGSNIKSSYKFAPDLWQILVDQSQIGQAIHNIVMNAREAMPEGGHIDIVASNTAATDKIASLATGNYVKVSITDQGSGIAAEEFDKIFDPYYSTKNIGNQKGMGLGLSICHSIIKKHGGKVTVESQIGVGTTFHIYLPATDAEPTIKPVNTAPDRTGQIFGEGKILVMDDDRGIRELAGEILQHLGYRVEFAGDGAEAVASYQAALKSADPFDAVILDLTVRGGMGGKETIQKLKAIDPDVKGIVSSGYSEDPGITGYEQHGFRGVVAKPYTLEELGEKLSQVLLGTLM
jgi:nitrogen-specific signal transduction histidine kinase/CheY-like chemotaxis protein